MTTHLTKPHSAERYTRLAATTTIPGIAKPVVPLPFTRKLALKVLLLTLYRSKEPVSKIDTLTH